MRQRVDRVFVINLERRHDRRQAIARRLAGRPFAGDVEFVAAVDGAGLEADALARLGMTAFHPWAQYDSWNNFYRREITSGEVGCFLSHLHVWREIVRRGYESAIILEDDVFFVPDFDRRYEALLTELPAVAPDWDLCYLGRYPFMEFEELISEGLHAPGFSYGAYAYMLSASGAAKVLASGFERHLIPTDELLPALYTRHFRPDVEALFAGRDRLRALSIRPQVVYSQVEESDTESSPIYGEEKTGRDPVLADAGKPLR